MNNSPLPQQGKPIAIFGEALFDRFPDGQAILGGAPFNVAWHLTAFMQNPCFISRIGQDATGDNIKQAMLDWGMTIENLQLDPDYPTGTVQVIFNKGEPSYDILANQAYDFIAQPVPSNRYFSVIYHGTLALRNSRSLQTLQNLIADHQGLIFIDVNLRDPWWDRITVNRCLSQAHWAKLNEDELNRLAPELPLQEAIKWLLTEHELTTVVVTCGSKGAIAVNTLGEFIEVVPTEGLTVKDTVGAGDAFSAVLLLGMVQNWPLPLTMERAQTFASVIVTLQGATVQDLSFYQPFIKVWDFA